MPVADLSPILIGVGGLVLRPPRLADVPAIEAAMSDFEVTRMLARVPYPYPKLAAAGWTEIANAQLANGTALPLMIAGDTAIGSVGIRDLAKAPELGFWLAPSHQGGGVMTAAVRAAIDLAFERGTTTIASGAFVDNPASLRVQEKLGFEIVGESSVYCLARRERVRHIHTRLSRVQYSRAA